MNRPPWPLESWRLTRTFRPGLLPAGGKETAALFHQPQGGIGGHHPDDGDDHLRADFFPLVVCLQ